MSVSVTDILARARSQADMHDNFVTETEWMSWMNQAHKQLLARIAKSGYILGEVTETLVANGSVAYSLSSEPLAILAVHELRSDNHVRRLRAENAIEGFQFTGGAAVVGTARQWRAFRVPSTDEMKITLYPTPSSGSYLVTTIPVPAVLAVTGAGDQINVRLPLGWEEWIVLEMARKAMTKEEGDTRGISALQKDIEKHITDTAWSRALADSPSVRNVDAVERGWSNYMTYGDPREWMFY